MAKPKNVLFFMFDQLFWEYLNCYGHPDLHTPNIDKLADKACGLIVPISSRSYVLHQGYRPTRGAMCTVEQPHLNVPILMLMHDWPLVHWNDGIWRRWAIAQCTMGSFSVVVVPPSFDNNLGFPQRVEDFAVQQLVAHSPIEAFAISVLPG